MERRLDAIHVDKLGVMDVDEAVPIAGCDPEITHVSVFNIARAP